MEQTVIEPAVQHADTPPPKPAKLALHPETRKLLLISPTDGRRLSWPARAVG